MVSVLILWLYLHYKVPWFEILFSIGHEIVDTCKRERAHWHANLYFFMEDENNKLLKIFNYLNEKAMSKVSQSRQQKRVAKLLFLAVIDYKVFRSVFTGSLQII